jgi:beta-lactamase regulating signal transducer with metallopeptidase domain
MIITSIILSLLALILSMWMGRRNPVRSSGLTAGMLVLLMFSPFFLWMPKIHFDLPWSTLEVLTVADSGTLNETAWSLMYLLMWVYLIGCAVLLTKLLGHFHVAKRWCNESILDQNEQHLELLRQCADQLLLTKLPEVSFSKRVNSPVITGLLNPVLLFPASASNWSNETLRMVMLHELGHLQRHDLWKSLAGQIACALHWFNPLVWILRKRLNQECEYACDAHVISCGAHPGEYINALCDVAESCQESNMLNSRKGQDLTFSAALSMANKASLRNRVENLIQKKPEVNKASSLIVMAILTLSTSAALAINLVRLDTGEINLIENPVLTEPDEVKLRLSADPFPGS